MTNQELNQALLAVSDELYGCETVVEAWKAVFALRDIYCQINDQLKGDSKELFKTLYNEVNHEIELIHADECGPCYAVVRQRATAASLEVEHFANNNTIQL